MRVSGFEWRLIPAIDRGLAVGNVGGGREAYGAEERVEVRVDWNRESGEVEDGSRGTEGIAGS